MIGEHKKNEMIRSIVIDENAYFFFMCTSRQIEDIVSFCCVDNNIEVLGIDTRFNLCDLWVTDICYKNKRLVNIRNGNNPIFLGPSIFHFTKDEKTSTRFAAEMIAMNTVIMTELKKVGVDMEDSIFNGIKKVIQNVSQLYCVKHLSQRDEVKINQLLGKTKSTISANNKAKVEIIKDIYTESERDLYMNMVLQKQKIVQILFLSLPHWKKDGRAYVPGSINALLQNKRRNLKKV